MPTEDKRYNLDKQNIKSYYDGLFDTTNLKFTYIWQNIKYWKEDLNQQEERKKKTPNV